MFDLGRFNNIDFRYWLSNTDFNEGRHLFIVASGYERRSRHWAEHVLAVHPTLCARFLVVGFKESMDHPVRQENDAYYERLGMIQESASATDSSAFLDILQSKLESLITENRSESIYVHIDYSSMPRSWYCNCFLLLRRLLRQQDSAGYWYTPGTYQQGDYPSTGIEDFKVFAGSASLESDFRTHILGLGFDRIRAQAIWSVLDPQSQICFYADPAVVPGYVEKVLEDNHDLLHASYYKFSVPLSDFVYAYSKIVDVVRDFRRFGDVVLVPDGPKPLILAASIVPVSLGESGVVCFHVTRPYRQQMPMVAVEPVGLPVGFRYQPKNTDLPEVNSSASECI